MIHKLPANHSSMNNILLTILLIFVTINCITNIILIDAIYDFNRNVVIPAHQMGSGLVAVKDTMKLFMPSISIIERAFGIFSVIKSSNVVNSVTNLLAKSNWNPFKNNTSTA